MCVLLGDFLRDTLALGSEARITIERELQLATQFLEIERAEEAGAKELDQDHQWTRRMCSSCGAAWLA